MELYELIIFYFPVIGAKQESQTFPIIGHMVPSMQHKVILHYCTAYTNDLQADLLATEV